VSIEHKGRPRNHGVGPLILPLLTLKNIRRMNDLPEQAFFSPAKCWMSLDLRAIMGERLDRRTDMMNAHRDLLKVKGVSLGKGCIRYSKPQRIDFKVVEMMLKATRESTGVICGHNAI
jgi:hypothetical protein